MMFRENLLSLTACMMLATVGGAAQIPWHTIDGGGAQSITGGTLELSGTAGQLDAGVTMTGGSFELTGGFWPGAAPAPPIPGDFDGDGDVDAADFAAFAQCFGGSNLPPAPTCPPGIDADFDDDGDVDALDFVLFGQHFTGSL